MVTFSFYFSWKTTVKADVSARVIEFSHILVPSSVPGGFALIYLMVVCNNAPWCSWKAINSSCLVGASCSERQIERGERAVFFSWWREPFLRLFYSVECTPALHFLWAFQIEEVEIKCGMPSSRRYTLEKKFVALMGSLINRQKYDDRTHKTMLAWLHLGI